MSGRRLGAACLLAALIVDACSGGGTSPVPSARIATLGATDEPSKPAVPIQSAVVTQSAAATSSAAPSESPQPSAGEGEFLNPVIPSDFPDPHVINVDGTYYAYATTGGGRNLQSASSEDLVHWEMLDDPLPELASWSGLTPLFSDVPHEATWAPAAAQIGERFVLYYTTPALEMERPDGRPSQCIGVATSDSPEGPFVDESEGPIACQAELGGSIDSTYFVDEDGTQYLIWKNDGNCCSIDTRFFIQELSKDGLELVGEPTDMGVDNDRPWEEFVIEAPTLVIHDSTYYLFYSGNDFSSSDYAVGYATAEAVLGPYTDAPENPILQSKEPAAGPGHQSVLTDEDGDLWMTFHAWETGHVSYQFGGRRAMWIDELVFEDGRAVVMGPDQGPQPVP